MQMRTTNIRAPQTADFYPLYSGVVFFYYNRRARGDHQGKETRRVRRRTRETTCCRILTRAYRRYTRFRVCAETFPLASRQVDDHRNIIIYIIPKTVRQKEEKKKKNHFCITRVRFSAVLRYALRNNCRAHIVTRFVLRDPSVNPQRLKTSGQTALYITSGRTVCFKGF